MIPYVYILTYVRLKNSVPITKIIVNSVNIVNVMIIPKLLLFISGALVGNGIAEL